MVSRDYTQEVGLKSATSKVPWPIAAMILATVAGLAWFGVAKLNGGGKAHAAPNAAAAKGSTAEHAAN